MKIVNWATWGKDCATEITSTGLQAVSLRRGLPRFLLLSVVLGLTSVGLVSGVFAQVNVLTAHNDNTRAGANTQETILTPANVSAPNSFGKIFTLPVNGGILTQPLYVSNVAIPNLGTHNVVYIATTADYVYAFDADTNGGTNAAPLWQANLLTNTAPAGTYSVIPGNPAIVGTPAIDLGTNTIYLVSNESYNGAAIFRFHALNITTGAEKFGGPIQIQASVPGTGSASVGGVLTFDAASHLQRPGLLFQNGVVYVAFGSIADQGAWHGWIFSFDVNPNTQKLQQVNVFCTTPNGTGGGIWQSGAGLVGEVYNPAKPYGRMFLATANGTYSNTAPYEYSMNVIDFDLTGGIMTVDDIFTPYNGVALSGNDGDLGSGGPILLPKQTLPSGQTYDPLLQIGKSGMFYILDRDNAADGSNSNSTYTPATLGGFNPGGDKVVQEVQTPPTPGATSPWGAGVWGTEAYWNNTIYFAGVNPDTESGLTAWPFVNGVLATGPSSTAPKSDYYIYAPPTPAVSANGNADGIVWLLKNDPYPTLEPEILLAYDATNLANKLYSSNTDLARDNPGQPQNHVVPTIANGKVYVPASGQVAVFGLLGPATQNTTPAPVISPASGTYPFPLNVTLSDTVPGATIYYTTNGTQPNSNSPIYNPAHAIVIGGNATVTAVASVTGEIQSAPASATYLSPNTPGNPIFSLAAGSYTGSHTLTITTNSAVAATIYYTLDGITTPTAASAVYTGPIVIANSATVQAIAIAGIYSSSVVSASYTILPVYNINFSDPATGFAGAAGQMKFNGSAETGDDVRLQLTNGGIDQAGSTFFLTPMNIQGFTTNFTFQLSNSTEGAAMADGITFTIQNAGLSALGGYGGALGYTGIGKSVAIKFDTYNDAGEGNNSIGLYIDGAAPTQPSVNLNGTGLSLLSGDFFSATISYNGTNLSLALTDEITAESFTYSWVVNIPAIVGGNTAYVGFTGGTGAFTSSQKLLTWTYLAGTPVPNYTNGFSTAGLVFNGYANAANGYSSATALNGTRLRLTDGGMTEARSAFYATQVNVQQFVSSFDFQLTQANADGFTFAIQGNGPTALGGIGGSLGYGGIKNSVAVKFNFFSTNGVNPITTGLYTNGAVPENGPSINLTGGPINFQSGHFFNATFTYNGTTLIVVITDLVTKGTATQTYTVNIPAIVGGPTAYVGFTGGSGGGTAIQDILNWTYSAIPIPQPVFPGGFAGGANLFTLNGNASLTAQRLRLTDGFPNEISSAFFSTPVNVQQFHTGFQFRLTNPNADGFTFTIQNNAPTALGNAGGGLGYAGIANSVAIKFDLYNNSGEGPDSTGFYSGGVGPGMPSINLTPTGVNLHSGDTFDVQMTYDGTTLTVVLLDLATNAVATQSYVVNIPTLVGGATAYVGFTGASGGETAIQDILNWSFSPGLPAAPSLAAGFANAGYEFSLNSGAVVNGNSLEITDGGKQEARSAFYTTQLNVQQFVTSFNFQVTNPSADGFTFTIQGVNPTVVGFGGGDLGFEGLAKSVAVKFDLYSNAGEGPSSTGVYVNGAVPTLPSTNLIPLGVNLHNGDIFNAQLTYNGTLLTVVITDTVTKATASQTYTVNIPAIVGGSTAYVGFTGGTGSLTAVQQILNWTYTSVDSI